MAQKITTGIEQLVAEAKAAIEEVTVEEAMQLAGHDDVVIVDLRDIRELQRDGKIPGSFHCPRGMLEFWIDPKSPYHKPFFAEDKTFVFYCALSWRSALATRTAQEMGLSPVAHFEGGFDAWKKAGGAVEPPRDKTAGPTSFTEDD